MRLVLVRHGEAEPVRTGDAERALTGHGRKQAALTGKWLAAALEGGGGCRLLASPYRRAQETAALLNEALHAEYRTLSAITPDEDVRRAVQALDRASSGASVVVVVTHMPLVAALASWLETGSFSDGRSFALAEARVYAVDELGPSLATLQAHYIPH